jgi:hypothetical protein
MSYSHVTYIRFGGDFHNLSVGWQYSWFGQIDDEFCFTGVQYLITIAGSARRARDDAWWEPMDAPFEGEWSKSSITKDPGPGTSRATPRP